MSEVNVTKEITFDCAHMLSGHDALCKNLHGHTYKVLVTVTGTLIEEGPSMGMVVDFKFLKKVMQEVIMHDFDHAVIFSSAEYRNTAEEELYAWAVNYGMRHTVMNTRTTAENMSLYFSQRIKECLIDNLNFNNIKGVAVQVYETPTSYAYGGRK